MPSLEGEVVEGLVEDEPGRRELARLVVRELCSPVFVTMSLQRRYNVVTMSVFFSRYVRREHHGVSVGKSTSDTRVGGWD